MKYYVTVNGEEHEVELLESLGRIRVRYDGEELDARYAEVDRLGQAALYLGDESYAVSIEGDANAGLVKVAGHDYEVEIEDESASAPPARPRAIAARAVESSRA